MRREVVQTDDGSTTIYIPELNENYHSSHGALQEAEHVFIKHGITTVDQPNIRVFELGFGTGLNALLSLKYAFEKGVSIQYVGLEAYPVKAELIASLNYVNLIGDGYLSNFELMHSSNWNEPIQISSEFELTKLEQKIENFDLNVEPFDLIYFDAFGHRAQPEMWDISVLLKMFDLLKKGGVMVTYAARGQFKRDLKQLGFIVESLPGPPGKREMTRAIKSK